MSAPITCTEENLLGEHLINRFKGLQEWDAYHLMIYRRESLAMAKMFQSYRLAARVGIPLLAYELSITTKMLEALESGATAWDGRMAALYVASVDNIYRNTQNRRKKRNEK